jgi:hypothetical protein
MAINVFATNCLNQAQQPGYAHWDSNQGVIDSVVGGDEAQLPNFVHVQNDMYCNQVYAGGSTNPITQITPSVLGNNFTISNGFVGAGWNFGVTPGALGGSGAGSSVMNLTQYNSYAAIGQYQFNFQNPTASTSGNDQNSPIVGICGTYYGSSISNPSCATLQTAFSGTSSTLEFTGAGTYSFDHNISAPNIPTVIANTTFTSATTTVSANTCSASAVTVTMTGVATSSVFVITPSTDVSGSNGWGANGGLVIDAWPTSNTLNYKICNQSGSSVTPAAVTWNVGAK